MEAFTVDSFMDLVFYIFEIKFRRDIQKFVYMFL